MGDDNLGAHQLQELQDMLGEQQGIWLRALYKQSLVTQSQSAATWREEKRVQEEVSVATRDLMIGGCPGTGLKAPAWRGLAGAWPASKKQHR